MNQVKNEKYLFFTSTAQPSQDLIKQFFFVPMNHMSLWTAKVWCGVWMAYIILNIPRRHWTIDPFSFETEWSDNRENDDLEFYGI